MQRKNGNNPTHPGTHIIEDILSSVEVSSLRRSELVHSDAAAAAIFFFLKIQARFEQ